MSLNIPIHISEEPGSVSFSITVEQISRIPIGTRDSMLSLPGGAV